MLRYRGHAKTSLHSKVESDDELPPLVGSGPEPTTASTEAMLSHLGDHISGSQATTASHTASPPKQDRGTSYAQIALSERGRAVQPTARGPLRPPAARGHAVTGFGDCALRSTRSHSLLGPWVSHVFRV